MKVIKSETSKQNKYFFYVIEKNEFYDDILL